MESENMSSPRDELINYSRLLSEKNLVIGPGGNTSCREGKFMYIKPSGITFTNMTVEDLVEVEIITGKISPHENKPSSEILMHLYLYQTMEIDCVFHAHPPILNGLVSRGVQIKHMFPDSVVYLGKEIPQIEYTTPCGEELALLVKNNIQNNNSIIMGNHGAITVGKNAKITFTRMEVLEGLAYTLYIALSSGADISEVKFLTDSEVEAVLNLDDEK